MLSCNFPFKYNLSYDVNTTLPTVVVEVVICFANMLIGFYYLGICGVLLQSWHSVILITVHYKIIVITESQSISRIPHTKSVTSATYCIIIYNILHFHRWEERLVDVQTVSVNWMGDHMVEICGLIMAYRRAC